VSGALIFRVRSAAFFVVAVVFAVAGALKLADPAAFATDIGHYRLVPPLVAAALAVYLPWLELGLAAALYAPRFREPARWLLFALTLAFSAGLASTLLRGIDISCGCFGGAGGVVPAGWALARNGVLCGLLIWAKDRSLR
jgi:hypothetical protein